MNSYSSTKKFPENATQVIAERHAVPPEVPLQLGNPMQLESVRMFSTDFWAGVLTTLTVSGLWRG
ncbi:hypothetical protein AB1L42_00895 [Thalassoglobus sp. JC818]|uniref:hypothetical protein n=1 Tax=Thalassoglobus sp. JC818 TaxID=3232136 RepID=UPI00345A8336